MADNEIATTLKFLKGNEANLPVASDATKGQTYFAFKNVGTKDKPSYTGAIYLDTPIDGSVKRIKMTANADIANYANKANLDTQGNSILSYLRTASLSGNVNTQTFTFSAPSGSKYTLTLNGVSDTQAGLVTSGNQTFPGYKTLKLRAKPSAMVGSDTEKTSGWYKVATCTMSSWGNANILYYIRNGYNKKAAGILNFEMRSNNTSIENWACEWLVRGTGLSVGTIRIVISGMTWTMYAYQPNKQYGRISITELSNTNINGDNPSWNITYYNSSTKETTEPSSTITSVDGGQVYLANKATFDTNSQNIVSTYIKSLAYSNDGKQLIATKGSGDTSLKLSLPIASTTKSGIVNTEAQSFGGTKTFTTINAANLNITGSSGFNYSGIETATGNAARPIWFAYVGVDGKPVINTNFTYNPATQTLTVENLAGTASKATSDAGGQDIRGTYIKSITVSGTTLTITKGSNATSTITLQDLNNKVTQTAITTKDYTNWRTVLWGASSGATEGFTPTTVTDGTYTSNNLSFQPSTGTLKATVFKGSLNGNASTASSATKATYDGGGTKEIRTYVSDVEISGRTITVTRGNGNTFTLTTQDTNTWRGIQDNVTSDSDTDSLSAKQGKYLKSLIDGKSNNGHIHTYLSLYGGRLADINLATSTNGAGAMFHFVATSATTIGKPPTDSNVLQMNWDNNGGYDSQLAISNGGADMYFRSQVAGTWKDWKTVLDSSNYNSYTVTKTGGGASGNWNISAAKLQTYKQGSTTETYGAQYPIYAQWQDNTTVKLKCDGYSTKVDRADKDGGGSDIRSTYIKYKSIRFVAASDKVYLTESNNAGNSTNTTANNANISVAIIPAATSSTAGVITTGAQTFSGAKTFGSSITSNSSVQGTKLIAYKTKMPLAGGLIAELEANTSRLYGDGLAISNPSTKNDIGWIRVTGTSEADTVLELATGNDGGAGEQIVVRQYNTSNTVANQITLLDTTGSSKMRHIYPSANEAYNLGSSSFKFAYGYISHVKATTDVEIASKVTLKYNTNNACLDFVFA